MRFKYEKIKISWGPQNVTGQSFSDYIRTEVLFPLGMESATFDIDKAMTPYPPTGYNLRGEPVPLYLYPSKASGGLFAQLRILLSLRCRGCKKTLC
jgi:CubicO group peptidase (beta-lactamase class C family)